MYRMYGISGGMDAKERMCLLEMGCGRNQTGSIHEYIHVFSLRPAKAVENCSRQFFPPQPYVDYIYYSRAITSFKPSLL